METFTTPGGLTVGLRDAIAEDEAIVFNAWLTAHRQNGDWPKRLSSRRYFDEHKVTITKLLARSRCVVACNAERVGQVFGFVVFEPAPGRAFDPTALHWIFVKQPFRRDKIGTLLLLEGAGITRAIDGPARACSHWTPAAAELRERGWNLVYDPFLVENLP